MLIEALPQCPFVFRVGAERAERADSQHVSITWRFSLQYAPLKLICPWVPWVPWVPRAIDIHGQQVVKIAVPCCAFFPWLWWPRRSKRAYAPSDLEGSYDPRFLAFEFTRPGLELTSDIGWPSCGSCSVRKMVLLWVYEWMLLWIMNGLHQPHLFTPGTSCCGTIRQGGRWVLAVSRYSIATIRWGNVCSDNQSCAPHVSMDHSKEEKHLQNCMDYINIYICIYIYTYIMCMLHMSMVHALHMWYGLRTACSKKYIS